MFVVNMPLQKNKRIKMKKIVMATVMAIGYITIASANFSFGDMFKEMKKVVASATSEANNSVRTVVDENKSVEKAINDTSISKEMNSSIITTPKDSNETNGTVKKSLKKVVYNKNATIDTNNTTNDSNQSRD